MTSWATPSYISCFNSSFFPALPSIPGYSCQNSFHSLNMHTFLFLFTFTDAIPIIWNDFPLFFNLQRPIHPSQCISVFASSSNPFPTPISVSWIYYFLFCNHTALCTYILKKHLLFFFLLNTCFSVFSSPPPDCTPREQMPILIFYAYGIVHYLI